MKNYAKATPNNNYPFSLDKTAVIGTVFEINLKLFSLIVCLLLCFDMKYAQKYVF